MFTTVSFRDKWANKVLTLFQHHFLNMKHTLPRKETKFRNIKLIAKSDKKVKNVSI